MKSSQYQSQFKDAGLLQLEALLNSEGFIPYPDTRRELGQGPQTLWQRADPTIRPRCQVNNEVYVNITLSEMRVTEHGALVEFDIQGEQPDGVTMKVTLWSVTPQQVMSNLNMLVLKLVAAWKASGEVLGVLD